MTVRVQMFALARQCAGVDVLELELPDGATVGDLRQRLVGQLPALGPLGARLLFAVNAEYSTDATRLEAESEVACIPPVSGG